MFHRRFHRRKNRPIKPHDTPRPEWIESLEARTLLSAPVILSESFNTNGTQSISAQFSTNVSASINNTTLVLYNLSNLTTLPNTAITFSYNSSTNTGTWSINYTPPGSSIVTHYLADDGDYQARLYADRVTDSSGTPMAVDSTFNFTYFKGDANGDTTVNALDFNALATNYGKAGAMFGQGDFDHNGTVNSADFAILASRYGCQTLLAAKPASRGRWMSSLSTPRKMAAPIITTRQCSTRRTPPSPADTWRSWAPTHNVPTLPRREIRSAFTTTTSPATSTSITPRR